MSTPLTRRRFIAISAAAASLALQPGRSAASVPVRRWRGVALGADAQLTMAHPNAARAEEIIAAGLAEVRRLERIFSLYHPHSAVARLNRDAHLIAPPPELVELLSRAAEVTIASAGAFDVTVQPLWQLYADHFKIPGADPRGPTEKSVTATLRRIGIDGLHIDAQVIRFLRPGMAITLNGIAQGFITDRVAERLRGLGMTDVLVHMGETRALGRHPSGRPWRIGLPSGSPLDLRDAAMATSAGDGFVFDTKGSLHHIIDPRRGGSPAPDRVITVTAREAATADALSTAALLLPESDLRALCASFGARAIVS